MQGGQKTNIYFLLALDRRCSVTACLKASVSVISTIEFGSLFQLLIVRGMKENLYMSLVVIFGIATAWLRPILEYASVVWNPIMKKESDHEKRYDQLEKVQKRCLRLCPTEISLPTLAERRCQIDMVETFKFLNGKYKTASSTFFELPHREGLRGHSHKIFKKDAKTEVAKQFFGNKSC